MGPTAFFWSLAGWGVLFFLAFSGIALMIKANKNGEILEHEKAEA